MELLIVVILDWVVVGEVIFSNISGKIPTKDRKLTYGVVLAVVETVVEEMMVAMVFMVVVVIVPLLVDALVEVVGLLLEVIDMHG